MQLINLEGSLAAQVTLVQHEVFLQLGCPKLRCHFVLRLHYRTRGRFTFGVANSSLAAFSIAPVYLFGVVVIFIFILVVHLLTSSLKTLELMHLIVIRRLLALFNYIIWLLWPDILGPSLCFACLLLLFQELLQFHFGHLWE